MRSRTAILIITFQCSLCLFPGTSARAGDELFSKVAMDAVFTDTKPQSSQTKKAVPLSTAERERAARIAALFASPEPSISINETATSQPTGSKPVESSSKAIKNTPEPVAVPQPPTPQSAEPNRKAATNSQTTSFSLVGQWAATATNGDVFAIAFTSAKQFLLVHLRSGKSSVSKGTFETDGNRLVFSGENTAALTADIAWSDSENVTMSLGTVKLNFQRKN
ncbi:hypothetical protein FHS27_006104 [Rhodopirellula rubra]|uniref:Uncharacterized protein n=1 Tax=Aporhodopirellula rubra TaxID=980271 RepID=A0A7W5E6P6_9BACT|nr:hypothetical protein [Aporhodopirellula rubra]MBB3210257.1 hypothetical protein [Aporhodopirellula rubra]